MEVTIDTPEPFIQHNPEFDRAQAERIEALVRYQKDLEAGKDARRPPEIEVEETRPALRIPFRTSDNDERGLYVVVPTSATEADVKKAIRAELKRSGTDAPVEAGQSLKL